MNTGTDERAKRLEGAHVVASVSGGKDSAAMCLWFKEQEIEHTRIFADTGWEHEDTMAHLEYLEEQLGPITRVQSHHGGMEDLIRKKGMFPSRVRRFCTQELKLRPIERYLKSLDHEVVNAIGIRAAESEARAKMPEWEFSKDFDCYVWRPLIRWTQEQVIDIHKRHNLLPNPLYLRGAERVGCWPCIFSRKSEIKHVAAESPERIDLIKDLEIEVEKKVRLRALCEGTTLEAKGHHPPTYFHTKSKKRAGMLPIREAVQWANTAHGGKQLVLIDDPPGGCMRWGLCE